MQLPQFFPVACHTDNVGPGSTFVVIKGRAYDGIEYVPLALEKGATTIVIQHDARIADDVHTLLVAKNIRIERVDDTRRALAMLSATALGYPAKKLNIIGITGTKGKTTSVFLLEHMLKTAGYATALLSSVKNSIGEHQFSTNLTTQQPDYLHVFFDACVRAGVTHVVMEVAAQASTLHRTFGLEFAGMLFTNFGHEHAEFYATQEEYFQAKYAFFSQCAVDAPVLINSDDPKGKEILVKNPTFVAFSLLSPAPYQAENVDDVRVAVALSLQKPLQAYFTCPALIGFFNAYNLFAALSMALALGVDSETLQRACGSFAGVPGRMERYVLPTGALCYVDYAHNPSSYENLLSLLRSSTDHLIVVFGAGGERDREKRPVMGSIAARYADTVVLTTDNPRSEDPAIIIQEIAAGIAPGSTRCVTILDRAEAIAYACHQSRKGTIIAILGKGADEYQMIGKVKHFFSDRQVVMRCAQMEDIKIC